MTESGNQSAYALAANATPFGHLLKAPGANSYEAAQQTAVSTRGPSDYEAYYGPAPAGVLNADVMGQIARTNLQLPAYYQVRTRFACFFRGGLLKTRKITLVCWVGGCRARTFTWSASSPGVWRTWMTVRFFTGISWWCTELC